jgi:hypothetical protein
VSLDEDILDDVTNIQDFLNISACLKLQLLLYIYRQIPKAVPADKMKT